MKKKRIIVTILLVVAVLFIYIKISSTVINDNYYRKLAWETSNHGKTIISWQTAKVSLVNVKEKPIHVAPILSGKINKFLLLFNGGRAVRVEFSTTQDGLLGPIILYFNPFTKQCIGGELRM